MQYNHTSTKKHARQQGSNPLVISQAFTKHPHLAIVCPQAKEIMYHKANLNRIMADYTSQPLTKIEEDTDRDR